MKDLVRSRLLVIGFVSTAFMTLVCERGLAEEAEELGAQPAITLYGGRLAGGNFSDFFSEPWNIKCSNKCAKPVFPGFSFFEPT